MTIYEALKRDHDKLQSLLDELIILEENMPNRKDLIDEIRDELIPHSRAEESVFYNSLRTIEAAKDVVSHAYREHIEAEALLKTLQLKDKIDAGWKKTARKLRDSLEHHIEEEEYRIFAVARQHITDEEANKIGEAFKRLKPEIKEEGFLDTTFDRIANMMPARFSRAVRGEQEHQVSAQNFPEQQRLLI